MEKREVCYLWKGEEGFEGEKCALGTPPPTKRGHLHHLGKRGKRRPRVVEAPPGVELNSLEGPNVLAETPLLVA